MKKFIDNLKRQAEENPLMAIVVGIAAVSAAAKLLDASTERSRAATHSREIDRRIRNSYK